MPVRKYICSSLYFILSKKLFILQYWYQCFLYASHISISHTFPRPLNQSLATVAARTSRYRNSLLCFASVGQSDLVYLSFTPVYSHSQINPRQGAQSSTSKSHHIQLTTIRLFIFQSHSFDIEIEYSYVDNDMAKHGAMRLVPYKHGAMHLAP